MKHIFFVVLFALSLILIFTPQFSFAETQEATPPVILDLVPGKDKFQIGSNLELQLTCNPIAKDWTITEGTLPPGLELDSFSGWITGYPTQEGVFTFSVAAKTESGDAVKEFTLIIYGEKIKVNFIVENGTLANGKSNKTTKTLYLVNGTATLTAEDIPSDMIATPPFILGKWVVEPPVDPNAITGPVTYTYRFYPAATVSFKVENGTWVDGTTSDIFENVALIDGKGTLQAEQVPQNMRPLDGFHNGAWLVAPSTEENAVEDEITYTYVFQPKPPAPAPVPVIYPKAKIIFRVVDGLWSSGEAEIFKYVILIDGKGYLNACDIPTAVADIGFCDGSWDADPFSSDNIITGDVIYTYTFKKEEPVQETVKVTFVVQNGQWTCGVDEVVVEFPLVNGEAVLDQNLIPIAVPDEGYRNGSWNISPLARIDSDGNLTYVFTYEKENVSDTSESIVSGVLKILLLSTSLSLMSSGVICCLIIIPVKMRINKI